MEPSSHNWHPPALLSCIQDLYANLSIRVRVNGKVSDTFAITAGLLQGDPLSPLLFAIFIDPMIRAVCASPECVSVGGMKMAYAYADDFAAVSISDDGIQQLVNIAK